jgi:N-acetylneuraminate lyase
LGWDLGPCRLPLTTLSQESYEEFYHQLAELSFVDKAPKAGKIPQAHH